MALSWIGTGRLIFSHALSDADFTAICERFVAAAEAMRSDGWWWRGPQLTRRAIQRRVVTELLTAGRARLTRR